MVKKEQTARPKIIGGDRVEMPVRLPSDMKHWIEKQAARYGGSQNSEIVRIIRMRMETEKAGA